MGARLATGGEAKPLTLSTAAWTLTAGQVVADERGRAVELLRSGQPGAHPLHRREGAVVTVHAGGAQRLGHGRQIEAGAETLVALDERDHHPHLARFTGQGDCLSSSVPMAARARDLLGEDASEAGGLERVELGLQRLTDDGGAGVADPRVRGRCGVSRHRAERLDSARARRAEAPGTDVERLRERGMSCVVLDGHLAPTPTTGLADPGGLGRHRAVGGYPAPHR